MSPQNAVHLDDHRNALRESRHECAKESIQTGTTETTERKAAVLRCGMSIASSKANERLDMFTMRPEERVVVFVIDQPFDVALRMLKRALALEGLSVPCEVDTRGRIRQELGVGGLKQNIVLYVDDPVQLLEATVMNPAGGLFIPEPIVLSMNENGCRVSVRSIQPVFASDLPVSLRGAVVNLHERILSAIQMVGQKQAAVGEMADQNAVPA